MNTEAIQYGYHMAVKDLLIIVDHRTKTRQGLNDITRAKDKELAALLDMVIAKQTSRFEEFKKLEELCNDTGSR